MLWSPTAFYTASPTWRGNDLLPAPMMHLITLHLSVHLWQAGGLGRQHWRWHMMQEIAVGIWTHHASSRLNNHDQLAIVSETCHWVTAQYTSAIRTDRGREERSERWMNEEKGKGERWIGGSWDVERRDEESDEEKRWDWWREEKMSDEEKRREDEWWRVKKRREWWRVKKRREESDEEKRRDWWREEKMSDEE